MRPDTALFPADRWSATSARPLAWTVGASWGPNGAPRASGRGLDLSCDLSSGPRNTHVCAGSTASSSHPLRSDRVAASHRGIRSQAIVVHNSRCGPKVRANSNAPSGTATDNPSPLILQLERKRRRPNAPPRPPQPMRFVERSAYGDRAAARRLAPIPLDSAAVDGRPATRRHLRWCDRRSRRHSFAASGTWRVP
jgi:hypothetical protein